MGSVEPFNIYVAKTILDLNLKSENFPGFKIKTLPLLKLCKCTRKLLDDADVSFYMQDEEMAYIKYNRYFIMRDIILEHPDYCKYQTVIADLLGDDDDNRIYSDRIFDELRPSLITRYAEIADEEARSGGTYELKNPFYCGPEDFQPLKSQEYITSAELYIMIMQSEKVFPNQIIFDCRLHADYYKSRILHSNCLNIDEAIIERGLIPQHCSMHFSADARSLKIWNSRFKMEHIVLYDWNTDGDAPINDTPLSIVKDMFESYDGYKLPPLRFLQGGYAEFVKRFPQLTTNDKVKIPCKVEPVCGQLIEYEEASSIIMKEETFDVTIKESPIINKNTKADSLKKYNKNKLRDLFDQALQFADALILLAKHSVSQEKKLKRSLNTAACSKCDKTKHEEQQKALDIYFEILRGDAAVRDSQEQGNLLWQEISDGLVDLPDAISSEDLDKLKLSRCKIEKLLAVSDCLSIENRQEIQCVAESVAAYAQENIEKSCDMYDPNLSEKAKYEPEIPEQGVVVIKGITGLYNFAQTCYMNSAIQCISHTESLRAYFLNDTYKRSGHDCGIAEQFAKLVKILWAGTYISVKPTEFRQVVGNTITMLQSSHQQDAEELWRYMINELAEELNDVKKTVVINPNASLGEEYWLNYTQTNQNIIVDLFEGVMQTLDKCTVCGHESVKFEHGISIHLPLPEYDGLLTLDNCFRYHFNGTTIEKRCPTCEQCGNSCNIDHVQKLDYSRLPTILTVILGRGTYDQQGNPIKNDRFVHYPLKNLDMREFLAPSVRNKNPPIHTNYNLYAIVNHYGDAPDSGHYTAYILHGPSKNWYCFDDSRVTAIDKLDAVVTSSAYILLYTKLHE